MGCGKEKRYSRSSVDLKELSNDCVMSGKWGRNENSVMTCEWFISKGDVSLDVGEKEGRPVMVCMFIARITMAEGSDVKIGFFICHRSGKDTRNGVKMRTCDPFNLKGTPDSKCVAMWLIVYVGLKLDIVLRNKLANKPRNFRDCEMT